VKDVDTESRRQALRESFPVWQPRTLAGWLDCCADRYAERPLVLTDDVRLSYADVVAESHRLADGLASLGVRPGDRVARVGAIAVPFNYLYKQDELRCVLADSECRVLVSMTGFRGARLSVNA
jgi:fatty-acyl-CoA synthase